MLVDHMTDKDVETPVESESDAIESAPKKEKKQRKVVRRKKSKKEKESALSGAIKLVVEGGKVSFGSKVGLKPSSVKKTKAFVLANNTPKATRDKILAIAQKSSIVILEFNGNTLELGAACNCPFPVAVLSVYDEGNSGILSSK